MQVVFVTTVITIITIAVNNPALAATTTASAAGAIRGRSVVRQIKTIKRTTVIKINE